MHPMSKKLSAPFLILLLAFSCSEKDHQPAISKESESKTTGPKVTVLSSLPDSSKPVNMLLKNPGRKVKTGKPIVHAFLDSATHPVKPPQEQAVGFFTNYLSKKAGCRSLLPVTPFYFQNGNQCVSYYFISV